MEQSLRKRKIILLMCFITEVQNVYHKHKDKNILHLTKFSTSSLFINVTINILSNGYTLQKKIAKNLEIFIFRKIQKEISNEYL